MKALDLARKAF